jgi:hypothetical protein
MIFPRAVENDFADFEVLKYCTTQCLFPVGPYSVHDRIELARRMDRDSSRKIGAELPEKCQVFMEDALFLTGLQNKDSNKPGVLPMPDWCLKPAVENSMYAYYRRFLQVLHALKDPASLSSHCERPGAHFSSATSAAGGCSTATRLRTAHSRRPPSPRATPPPGSRPATPIPPS